MDDNTIVLDMWNTDCIRCDSERQERQREGGDFGGSLMRRMILCPECGNKRCPRASWHENACTGSNEPGQDGSVY